LSLPNKLKNNKEAIVETPALRQLQFQSSRVKIRFSLGDGPF
jgi:hypothetical protein